MAAMSPPRSTAALFAIASAFGAPGCAPAPPPAQPAQIPSQPAAAPTPQPTAAPSAAPSPTASTPAASAPVAPTKPPEPKTVQSYVRVSTPRVVLAHVRVIDGAGHPPVDDRNVVVEGGKITAIQPG